VTQLHSTTDSTGLSGQVTLLTKAVRCLAHERGAARPHGCFSFFKKLILNQKVFCLKGSYFFGGAFMRATPRSQGKESFLVIDGDQLFSYIRANLRD
jgi:hypothetical protein